MEEDIRQPPLTPSEELYKERLEYLIPITLDMTKEEWTGLRPLNFSFLNKINECRWFF